MKHYPTTCKFCKKTITIEIDDDYSITEDPYKILPLASCNTCADLRTERRSLEGRIQFSLSMFRLSGKRSDPEFVKGTKSSLTKLTQDYARLIARWHRMDGELWEPEIVEQLVDNPDHWGEALSRMWRMFREWQKQQDQQPALPYADV